MPEIRDPGREQEKKENRRFISEKVVRPARTRRQMAERGVVLVLAAAVFGAVAAVSFAVTVPMADRVFGEEPATEPRFPFPRMSLRTHLPQRQYRPSLRQKASPSRTRFSLLLKIITIR